MPGVPRDEAGPRRRDDAPPIRRLAEACASEDAADRLGHEATVLAAFESAGARIPETWVIETGWFEATLAAATAGRRSVRSLVRIAGSPEGDDACARAYDDVARHGLPDGLVAAVEAWWGALEASSRAPMVVRPSLAASPAPGADGARLLPAIPLALGLAEVLEAVRLTYASAVSSLAIAEFAEAGLKSVSLAILLQPGAPPGEEYWLVRRSGTAGAMGWDVATLTGPRGDAVHRVQYAALEELGPRARGPSAAGPVPAVGLDAGREARLVDLADVADRVLERAAWVSFFLDPADGVPVVLAAAAAPNARERGRASDALWLDVSPDGTREGLSDALSCSVASRACERAVHGGLHALGAPVDEPREFLRTRGGRVLLALDALGEAVRDLPAPSGEELLLAVGSASRDQHDRLVRRSDSPKRRLRQLVQGAALVGRQRGLLDEIGALERSLQRDARTLGELDLTLLPTDGLATTVEHAGELLDRAALLEARVVAAEVSHRAALSRALRRSGHTVSHGAVASLVAGASGTLGVALVEAVARGVEVLGGDAVARAAVASGANALADLPDGAARGALGQLLSTFGDMAGSPFSLAVPRWREEPAPLFRQLRAWLVRPDATRNAVILAGERTQARADAELARLETSLGRVERTAVRWLVERCRELSRMRATIDRLVLRSLALLRGVLLDADRRVRRIDATLAPGAVFAVTCGHLLVALRTGRPELGRVVAMRRAEQRVLAELGSLPVTSTGWAPELAPAASDRAAGLPGCAGVAEGPVRIARWDDADGSVRRGEVLVARALPLAEVPRAFLAAGVVTERGGMAWPAIEALRELGIPTVLGFRGARAAFAEGDRVRLDGERGQLQPGVLGERA